MITRHTSELKLRSPYAYHFVRTLCLLVLPPPPNTSNKIDETTLNLNEDEDYPFSIYGALLNKFREDVPYKKISLNVDGYENRFGTTDGFMYDFTKVGGKKYVILSKYGHITKPGVVTEIQYGVKPAREVTSDELIQLYKLYNVYFKNLKETYSGNVETERFGLIYHIDGNFSEYGLDFIPYGSELPRSFDEAKKIHTAILNVNEFETNRIDYYKFTSKNVRPLIDTSDGKRIVFDVEIITGLIENVGEPSIDSNSSGYEVKLFNFRVEDRPSSDTNSYYKVFVKD